VYNIEYAQHGCYHCQSENVFFARHTEFAYKNEIESVRTLKKGLEILRQAGMSVHGFRQPGWDINCDFSICRAVKSIGLSYIAGSSLDAGFNDGRERVSNYFPVMINGIINFPQNVEIDWSFESMKMEVDKIVDLGGLISIKGHFVNGSMPNSFCKENIYKLRKLLDYLIQHYGTRIRYATLKEITGLINTT
jgi:hypothetical protein